MLTTAARPLARAELADVQRMLALDPIIFAQLIERIGICGLSLSSDARLLAYGAPGRLESLCWLGGNVIPVRTSPASVEAFATAALAAPRVCSSFVGEANSVLAMWERLSAAWGPAREVRTTQPLLATWAQPRPPSDPGVRLARSRDLDELLPAAVAMYTEEVGVSPLGSDGGRDFRARLKELVRTKRVYVKMVAGRVVFKAELAVVTAHTAQVQGVWVDPQWRGNGIATFAMAAVVRDVLSRLAPSVSLYVNSYNEPARRVYHRCGFRQVSTFATVLL